MMEIKVEDIKFVRLGSAAVVKFTVNVSHDDVNVHSLNLKKHLCENRAILSVTCAVKRCSGQEHLVVYQDGNEKYPITLKLDYTPYMIIVRNNTIEYRLENAGDDFELLFFDYLCTL